MKTTRAVIFFLTTILGCIIPGFARADLLNVVPAYPKVSFVNQQATAVTYDPSAQVVAFAMRAGPINFQFSPSDSGLLILGSDQDLSVTIAVDNNGVLTSGTGGFSLSGQINGTINNVPVSFSGVLLTGDVTAFGFAEFGAADNFDFEVTVTGGAMQSYFDCSGKIALSMVSESSTFNGSFATEFHGSAKGELGPSDTTPPTIICPPNAQVITTPATNDNVPGFIITYPNPMVSDNCDPTPMVLAFDDSFNPVPSGTFVALNAGDSLTITLYVIDAAGNFSLCSFVVVMQEPDMSGPIDFGGFTCEPATLCNDPGKCYATYRFPQPVATNSAGQMFPAMATAFDEGGAVITLHNLGDGTFQGQFPRTIGGTNIITFTATDGQGNSAVQQCHVLVKDCEAPTLVCVDQAGTFKPLLTNALSCITAKFGCNVISSNNTIWFSSVLNTPSGNKAPFTVRFFDQHLELTIDGTNLVYEVPEAIVTFSNNLPIATTIFTNGQWVTIAKKPGSTDNTFLSGLGIKLPFDTEGCRSRSCHPSRCYDGRWRAGRDDDDHGGRRRRHEEISATWCGRFEVSRPDVVLKWTWGAAVYTQFSPDYNALGIKPIDARTGSAYVNYDNAGTPECFKQYVIAGARGDGRYSRCGDQGDKYTGELTDFRRANLGFGTVCFGPVVFNPPVGVDNCDNSVSVTSVPPSGSIFGPGAHTITSTAVDASGNTNQCSFTLTVLAPLQVVFDSPCSDNIADNSSSPDAGFTDMNCPDDPSTPQYVNRFSVCDLICHAVRLVDCNGQDVTSELAGSVTVHIDVTERAGSYWTGSLVADVPQNFSGIGSPGGIMVPGGGQFRYTLNTAGYEAGTVSGPRFFRSCVWVEYNTSPGIPVGMEDVILESR